MNCIENRLKERRTKMGLSQRDVAEALQITPSGYNMIENGKNGKKFSYLPKLAKLFHCRIDDLFPEMDGYIPPTEEPQSVHDSPAQPEDSHNAAPAADADVPARPNDVVPPIQGKPTTAALDADNWWELLGLEL